MLKQIQFNSNQFDSIDNELVQLTSNTIILCKNSYVKNTIATEIMKSFNDKDYPNCDFYYDNDNYNIEVQYKPTTILKIFDKDNNKSYNKPQKIIISTEAPFVLQCKSCLDLWFTQINNKGKIYLYAFTDFKGHNDDWDKGIYNVYKKVISGIYGDFTYGN